MCTWFMYESIYFTLLTEQRECEEKKCSDVKRKKQEQLITLHGIDWSKWRGKCN